MGELIRFARSGFLFRLWYDNASPVFLKDNSDSEKYVSFESDLTRIYNSAFWTGQFGGTNRLLLTLICNEPITLISQYSGDGGQTWNNATTFQFQTANNDYYTYNQISRYPNTVIYQANIDEWESIISSEIPCISDVDEYTNYILNPYIAYVWRSVPSISGKNGILSLPVLIDTDGNPVSNGSASDFSTLPDSVKVRTLADLAVQ